MQISPFEIKENHKFTVRIYDEIKADDDSVTECLFQSKKYGIIEQLITQSLYKYEYLNSFNIERLLNLYLKPKLRKKSYAGNIKSLLREGTILATDYIDYTGTAKLTLYFLSKGAYNYMKNVSHSIHPSYDHDQAIKDTEETETIMRRMSLNQWHISMLCGKNIHSETYYSKRRVGLNKYFFESCLILRFTDKKEVAVVSVAASKGNPDDMIAAIKRLDDIFAKSYKKNMYLFINCESQEHILRTQNVIDSNRDLQFVKPVYTTDAHTAKCAGLKWLYTCKRINGMYEIHNFDYTESITKKRD